MPTNNCGSWAKSIVTGADVTWPPEANLLNGGTGLEGPMDYTLLPQISYYLSVAGYQASQNVEFGLIEYESFSQNEVCLIPGIRIPF